MSILGSLVGTAAAVVVGNALSKVDASAKATNNSVTTTSIKSRYVSGNSRLVDFKVTDGSEDDKHRAWLKLEDFASATSTTKVDDLKMSLPDDISPIVDILKEGYTEMIITQFQEGLEEKQSVMPTIGDTFALTFSGKSPNLVTISGLLPFDYTIGSNTNWYTLYANAYKFIFRASILAKYQLRLRLIFPDFSDYTIYPVSFTSSMNSAEDNLIPFSMGAYVIGIPKVKAENCCPVSLGDSNPADVIADGLASVGLKQAAKAVNEFSNNKAVKTIISLQKLGFKGAVATVAGSTKVAQPAGRRSTAQ